MTVRKFCFVVAVAAVCCATPAVAEIQTVGFCRAETSGTCTNWDDYFDFTQITGTCSGGVANCAIFEIDGLDGLDDVYQVDVQVRHTTDMENFDFWYWDQDDSSWETTCDTEYEWSPPPYTWHYYYAHEAGDMNNGLFDYAPGDPVWLWAGNVGYGFVIVEIRMAE